MEMDYQNRLEHPIAHSVIARLMDLDKLSHQQPLHVHQRVLSESYISKTTTMGLRKGRSIYVDHLSARNIEMFQGEQGISGVQECNRKTVSRPDKCPHLGTSTVEVVTGSQKGVSPSFSKSRTGASIEDKKIFGKKLEHLAPGYSLKCPKKFENDIFTGQCNDLGADQTSNFSKFQWKMMGKPCFSSTGSRELNSKSEDMINHQGYETLDLFLRSESRDQRSKNLSVPVNADDSYLKDSVVLFPSSFGDYDYKNNNGASLLLLNQFSSRKKIFETSKTGDMIHDVKVSKWGQSHNNKDDLSKLKLLPNHLNVRLGANDYQIRFGMGSKLSFPSVMSPVKLQEISQLNFLHTSEFKASTEPISPISNVKQVKNSLLEFEEPRCGSDCENYFSPNLKCTVPFSDMIVDASSNCFSCMGTNINSPEAYLDETANSSDTFREAEYDQEISMLSKLAFQNSVGGVQIEAETFNEGLLAIISKDQQLDSNPGISSVKDSKSSCFMEVFSAEASLNGLSEGKLGRSNYSRGLLEFQKYVKGTNLCSPDSVLEPHDTLNSSTVDSCDSKDLPLLHQASESEEMHSFVSEMGISGDKEDTECIGDVSHDITKVCGWLQDGGSMNFSYLAELLDEAGIFNDKLILDIKLWHRPECPISPLVFETLEKKYGTQTSWQKSDRLLLFDLINSGLIQIVDKIISFDVRAAPGRSRLIGALKRNEAEDELWMMLTMHEKEKSRDESEKAVEAAMKSLDEEMNIICAEVETSLFDDLVMETISLSNE